MDESDFILFDSMSFDQQVCARCGVSHLGDLCADLCSECKQPFVKGDICSLFIMTVRIGVIVLGVRHQHCPKPKEGQGE